MRDQNRNLVAVGVFAAAKKLFASCRSYRFGRTMKKRYWIGGISAVAASAVAAKLLLRPRDVEWDEERAQRFSRRLLALH